MYDAINVYANERCPILCENVEYHIRTPTSGSNYVEVENKTTLWMFFSGPKIKIEEEYVLMGRLGSSWVSHAMVWRGRFWRRLGLHSAPSSAHGERGRQGLNGTLKTLNAGFLRGSNKFHTKIIQACIHASM